jgi:intracellular sulfur oxidation DsrE/DsrF family protein
MLVGDSSVKLLSFRSAFRQFQNHESRAKDMIDTVYNVLDRDTDATMGVVREVAGLFHGEGEKEKQASVLEALNGFRVEVSGCLCVWTIADVN